MKKWKFDFKKKTVSAAYYGLKLLLCEEYIRSTVVLKKNIFVPHFPVLAGGDRHNKYTVQCTLYTLSTLQQHVSHTTTRTHLGKGAPFLWPIHRHYQQTLLEKFWRISLQFDWWRYFKVKGDVKFRQIEGIGRKFRHIEQSCGNLPTFYYEAWRF